MIHMMREMSWICATLLLCCAGELDGQEQNLPPVFLTKIVPRAQFSVERLVTVGRAEARRHAGLLSIWFFTSQEDAEEFWFGKPLHPVTYRGWRSDYDRLSGRPWDVAQFLAFQGSSVFQMRDRQGTVISRVVEGSDFRKLHAKGVYVDIMGFGQSGSHDPAVPPTFVILARTRSGLSEEAAKLIWDLFGRTRARFVEIVLRPDPWFMQDVWHPVFDPFESTGTVPTKEEARRLPYMRCMGRPGEQLSCFLQEYDFEAAGAEGVVR